MLDHTTLLAHLHYNQETGVWARLIKTGAKAPVGARADRKRAIDTRRTIDILGRRYLSHRLAWFYMTGEWPKKGLDHENTDPSGNRWPNLREATQRQNNGNARRAKHNKSGFKGVYWNKEKSCWTAQIKKEKSTHLGYFKTPEAAHAAYVKAAQAWFGEFARA